MTTEEIPEDQTQPESNDDQSSASKPEEQLQVILDAAKTGQLEKNIRHGNV